MRPESEPSSRRTRSYAAQQPEIDGGYALAPGASLPPLVIDDDEAMALAVAIQSHLAGSRDQESGDAALRALTKIVQVMPRRLRTRLDAVRFSTAAESWDADGAAPRVDHGVLSVLALGCRDGERMRFDYRAADGRASQRRVEPFRLVPLGRRWYLVGYDLDRGDWRTFRIDRIGEAAGGGTPFAHRMPPFEDVLVWVREKVGTGSPGGRHHVEVVVETAAADVTTRVGGWAEDTELSPTRCRMTMHTESLEGPLIALGLIGADFHVVEPPELAAAAGEWGARLTRGSVPCRHADP